MLIKKRKTDFVKKVFSFKLFIVFCILISVFIGTKLGKEYYREYQIQKEINLMKEDIESLDKNNYTLSQLIEYYKTEEYKEAEARKRLNLKKEGENVVIIKSNEDAVKGENIIVEKENNNNENLPNYRKWWNYFFAAKSENN